MGGGDLNTKKAWHPSTLKNQERVWKAEQAAAEEQKRILELQRERAQERDREELNKLAKHNSVTTGAGNDNRLSWMYDEKPDKKTQQEDYLLGKAIDKNYENAGKTERNEIPAVSRRVVGSSMITSGGDTQVDLARKLREDPLLLVKERERAARAALLNNPVQRRKLAELLRKEQEQKSRSKHQKSEKRTNDIDNLLAAKLNALGGEKSMNIAKLLASDDSSSDSSSEDKKSKQKKKKKKKRAKSVNHTSKINSESPSRRQRSKELKLSGTRCGSSVSERESLKYNTFKDEHRNEDRKKLSPKKRQANRDGSESGEKHFSKKNKRESSNNKYKTDKEQSKDLQDYNIGHKISRLEPHFDTTRKDKHKDRRDNRRLGLSEEEKAARLAEMVAAGAEREVQRGRRVAEQRAENTLEQKYIPGHLSRNEARSLPDSLESRIRSNRHYIQRDNHHMNENFARR